MKRIIMFVLLFAALKVAGQTTGYLRFDTVKIMRQNGTCELYVINNTKDSLGLLTNVGGGLTRFIKPKMLNDSMLIVGLDTLTIHGAGAINRFGLEDNSATANRTFNANGNNFNIDSVGNWNVFSKSKTSGTDRGALTNFGFNTNNSINLWSYIPGASTRSYGFNAYGALTQMFAAGHVAGHATYVQSDTLQVILEADPNRLYMFHDSVSLHNITGGAIDFRIRTLPLTIDTSYKALVSGPNGQVYLRAGDNGGGGGGSQTFPQVLSTGRTFTDNDSAIINNLVFKFKGGTIQTDTLDVLKTIRVGTTQSVDDRLKMIVKDASVDTSSFAAIELKTTNDDEDLNVDGATVVKHDSAYKMTPGYGNTLQVYTLAGSAGTIIGNNNFVGVTTPYAPGENETSNGFVRFELGPIWPKSEKMRLNNRGEIIFGWTKVRSHLASQTGTTVNDPVNTFLASDVGKFFCWGDREIGGSAAFADRIVGYIDANNITVETNRTITAQGGRVCIPNAIIDTLGNALYRYVSLDSVQFATGGETSFFKLKPLVDTLRLVREGTATDAAFDMTNGITVARVPRDVHLMGTTYSKLHFRDATHTLSTVTANSTATSIETLDDLPINLNPNGATAASITSSKVQLFKPTIISGVVDAPIAKLDVRNPDASISAYIENSRGSGTNYGAIIDVTAAASENRALYATANNGSVNKAIAIPSTSASGTDDFAVYSATSAKSYFAGKVGVGTSTPDSTLQINGSLHNNAGVRFEGLPAGPGTKSVRIDANGTLSVADTTAGGGSDGNGIYGGNGTLPSDVTVSTGGNTLTVSGSNDNETSFSVTNTGTTSASAIAGTASGTTSTGVTGTSSSYIGVFGSSTSNTGVQGQSSSGVGVIGVSSTGAGLRGQINPSSSNAIENAITLLRTSSAGAGANGIGAAMQYELETATNGNSQTAGSLAFQWTDATTATRTSQFEIYGVNSATTARKAAIAGNGQWTWDTYGSGTHTGTPTGSLQVTSGGSVVEGPLVASGTWSPTLTDGTNSSGATVSAGRYTRIGNIVTFSLTITTTTSAGASATTVTATLPVASNFTTTSQASGTNSGLRGSVTSNTSDVLNIDWTSNTGGSETITITGQYIIL